MRRHQQSLSKKVCFAWLGRDPDFPQGCTYGRKCAFAHAKDVTCQKWLKGICEHDANSCRYVHHHNPAEVRFEPGTKLCVQCVVPPESAEPMSKSSRPSNIEVRRSTHADELEQLDKQLEDINNSIDSETQTRNMLTENNEKAGLILQEAADLVPGIKKLQSDLILAQQRLDDLKEQYEICVTSHHSVMVNFDENKLQGLLRVKASLLETIESKRKAVRHAQKKSPSSSSSSPTIGWKQTLLDHQIAEAQTSLSLQSDEKTCVVCLDKERTFALNCGHLAYCEDCVYLLDKCAICQQPVELRQRIHVP